MSARCGVKGCRRVATQAWDVARAWTDFKREVDQGRSLHYEVCDKHSAEYFPRVPAGLTGNWVRADFSERIKRDIRSRGGAGTE